MSDGSYLYSLVTHKDQPHMPPNADKLPAAKIEITAAMDRRRGAEGFRLQGRGQEATAEPGDDRRRPRGRPARRSCPRASSASAAVYTPRPGGDHVPWPPVPGRRWWPSPGSGRSCSTIPIRPNWLACLPFPEGIPYSLRFSRSGKLLAGRRGQRGGQRAGGRLRRHSGQAAVSQVGDELDAVLAADINASQTLIALGGPQKIVRVFNVADGAAVVEIRKHTDWITAVEFSPDGVLLATADRAGGVWVWEAGTDREFQALEGHKAAVTAMSWRDDSNVLATASEDGTIALWSMENGKRIKNISAHPGGVDVACNSCTTGGSFPAAAITPSNSGTAAATRSASSSPWANW